MASSGKDTIYIDVDDEITSIIDKVRKSEHKIVALVLPKRATMLQSSVNMKLLRRAAEGAKKNIVLITSETGLMPLAAAAGVHVAKTLQSKPEVPEAAEDADHPVETSSDGETEEVPAAPESGESEFDAKAAANKSIGDLAGLTAVDNAEETIELDNPKLDDIDEPKAGKHKKASKIPKSLRVPNFEKFRLRLILAGLVLILLIVGLVMAAIVLPKAQVTVDTDTSSITSNLSLNLDSTAKTLDPTKLIVPAKVQSNQKTTNQQVPTTGQKNQGDKATGSVNMTAQACAPNLGTPNAVPSGSGISTGGLTFITQQAASFVFDHVSSGSCNAYKANNITIAAQGGGSNYNVTNATFSVAGRSDVSATGTTSGGTDDIIKIVAQADIDSAKQKLGSADTSSIKSQLQNDLQTGGYFALPDTFSPGTPTVTTSANVGDQADTITVTQVTTYTMFGVMKSDLQKLVDADVDKQIDTSKQTILDDGLSKASFNVVSLAATTAQLAMQSTAIAGPHLDVNSLKAQIAGKKSGEVKSIIGANPGVSGVSVKFSPFWVDSTPKKASKVTILFVSKNHVAP